MLYGACYYPEHRNESDWAQDLRLMKEAGINALRIGEFAWKRFEPSEGIYTWEWLDRFVELSGEHAIGLVLCPPMRTVPAWFVEKEPSLLLETQEGNILEYASRYTFCINHPVLREKSERLAAEMAARYGSNKAVIGWHLDNEIGDEPDCHCSICKHSWQQWLTDKYNHIDELNSAWGTVFWGMEFDHFGQIPTPRITKADYNPSFIQAWRQFRSDCNVEATRLLADAVRPHMNVGEQYISTNNQMLWNNRTDYYEMAKHLDIAGTNYYPPYGDNCRVISLGLAVNRSCKKAPFHVYELRNEGHAIMGADNNTPAPGELERVTLHTIANGADGVFYFPWKRFPFGCEQNHGAITDFAGKPTRLYEECCDISAKLHRIAPQITGSMVASDLAVLYDYPGRWHIEQPSGWTGDTSLYVKQIDKLYHTVRSLGYNCDAVSRSGDLSAYRILLVPMLPIVDDELVMKLQQYVKDGGTLVLHPMSGIKNSEACYYPDRLHPGIIELLGSTTKEVATSSAQKKVSFGWEGRTYQGAMFHELIQPTTAEVDGTFADQWFAGYAAVTRNQIGNGQCLFIATFAEDGFYKDLVSFLCQQAGLQPLLGITPPEQIEVTMRQDADGTEYIFLLNCSAQESEIELQDKMTDIWNQEQLEGRITLEPYQVRIVVKGV